MITDSHIHTPQRSTIPRIPQSTPNNNSNISLKNCTHFQSSMYESDHIRSNNIVHPSSPPTLYYTLKRIVADNSISQQINTPQHCTTIHTNNISHEKSLRTDSRQEVNTNKSHISNRSTNNKINKNM